MNLKLYCSVALLACLRVANAYYLDCRDPWRHCGIETGRFTYNPFPNDPDSFSSISIGFFAFDLLDNDSMASFNNLTSLEMVGVKIITLDIGILENIQNFKLSYSIVENIVLRKQSTNFSNLQNLTLLNNIIPESFLTSDWKNLNSLSVENMDWPLKSISDHFKNANLNSLALTANEYPIIWHSFFDQRNAITSLNLRNNKIRYLFTNFQNFHLLANLNLMDNLIFMLPYGGFSNLRSIETINLSNNRLIVILENHFHDLKNLREIDLTGNNVLLVENGKVFNNLKGLKYLYLEPNNEVFSYDFKAISGKEIQDNNKHYEGLLEEQDYKRNIAYQIAMLLLVIAVVLGILVQWKFISRQCNFMIQPEKVYVRKVPTKRTKSITKLADVAQPFI